MRRHVDLEIRALRIKHRKPMAEAALDLRENVKGDGFAEIEHPPLTEPYQKAGWITIRDKLAVFNGVQHRRPDAALQECQPPAGRDGGDLMDLSMVAEGPAQQRGHVLSFRSDGASDAGGS